MKVLNSKGKIYYGMHFYPGVAEYQETGKEPYRVYLNEDTLRSMDPTFAGRPIFVEHVDEVNEDVNELRKDADGWVIESFFNTADGKHWVKFIAVSDRAERAIASGLRLSNAYIPNSFADGGLWNGVSYTKEITGGEFEHLAIVRNPRYEESVIMTPEQFKLYNENHLVELKRLANSKDQKGEGKKMSFNLFKRTKVENAVDIENMSVVLPKSKKEMSITELINEMDAIKNMHGYANGDHMVKVGENEMSVNELIKKHMSMNDELEDMKKKKEDAADPEIEEGADEVGDRGGDKSLDNEEDDGADKEDKKDKKENEDGDGDEDDKKDKKKNELAAAAEKKKADKAKADKLRNAHNRDIEEESAVISFSADQVERGKALFGSN